MKMYEYLMESLRRTKYNNGHENILAILFRVVFLRFRNIGFM